MTHKASLYGNRGFAHRLVDAAPSGSVMTISEPKRTLDQNAKLWVMLSEISAAKPEGREMVPETWKAVFCHALGHEQRFEMALDGKGFVPVGFKTSRMNKRQMSDLIEFIHEYAARHGVQFND